MNPVHDAGGQPVSSDVEPPLEANAARELRMRLKVLVAEDNDDAREVLVKAIRALGHDCRSARDGLEAWAMHREERADVILSDLQMPRMDGFELCRRTRVTSEEDGYTYFIFMTGFGDKASFVQGMEAGADDYHTKPVRLDELRARLVSAARVVGLYRTLAEKNAMLRRDSQVSFRLARRDALTEAANRLRMDEDMAELNARAKSHGLRYSMAICDVDRFKTYNDHFGHLAGDQVLRRVAQAIRSELRETDGFYRYGGEEFVIIFTQQSLARAARAAERVRRAIEALAISMPDVSSVVTVSFGVAELDATRDAMLQNCLRRADAALYRAKSRGRNRVEVDRMPETLSE